MHRPTARTLMVLLVLVDGCGSVVSAKHDGSAIELADAAPSTEAGNEDTLDTGPLADGRQSPDQAGDAQTNAQTPDAEDASCSPFVATPCGACGGTIRCDGSCSVSTPTNLGTSCGSCSGHIQCDGTCSLPPPANLGRA